MNNFSNTNWNDLLYSISENEAVILIGPEIFADIDPNIGYSKLFEKLATERPEAILDFYPKEELFLFNQEMDKGVYVREIKKHFKRIEDLDIFTKLIEIPFHLYLKSSPDLVLSAMFEKYKIKHQFKYFSPVQVHEQIDEITAENPLIYNILGTLQGDDESIILSHDNLFQYLQSILGEKGIPQELRKSLQNSNELIFIGFQFNKWYMQLLLRILELDKAKFAFNRIAAGLYNEGSIKELCFNQFKIKIIDSNAREFINELYERCKNSKEVKLRSLDKSKAIDKTLEDAKNEEQNILKEKLKRLYKLLSEYELELDLEKDPMQRMSYEMKISGLKEKIAEAKNELQNL